MGAAAALAIATALPAPSVGLAAEVVPVQLAAPAADALPYPASELELRPPPKKRGAFGFLFGDGNEEGEEELAPVADPEPAPPTAATAAEPGPPLSLLPKRRSRRAHRIVEPPPPLPRPRPTAIQIVATERAVIVEQVRPVAVLPTVQLMPVPAVVTTAAPAPVPQVRLAAREPEPHETGAPEAAPTGAPAASPAPAGPDTRSASPEPRAEGGAQTAPAPAQPAMPLAASLEPTYPPMPPRIPVAAAAMTQPGIGAGAWPTPAQAVVKAHAPPAAPARPAVTAGRDVPRKAAVKEIAEVWPDPFGNTAEWRQPPLAAIAAAAPLPVEPRSVGSLGSAAGAEAAGDAEPPYELVRRLQALQDEIAHGSTEAFVAQRSLLAEIDERLAATPAEAWQDERNARAIVTYVLSGGNPAALRNLIEKAPLPHVDDRLVRGALAYLDGNIGAAGELLAEIDAAKLPASMGSQVALAQSALVVAAEPEKAGALLDLARLLSPGTLAEEAALRRQIFVVDQLGDVDKFEALSRQYLERFRHSAYAGNFRQRFAAALTRMEFINDAAEFDRLDDMLSELDPASRLDLYLTISRAAVTLGKATAASLAAERALALADPAGPDAARARLYRAAVATIARDGLEPALGDLQAIDAAVLEPADAALHEAAVHIADSIGTAADFENMTDLAPPTDPAAEEEALASVPAIARGREALRIADALLEGKR
jgi:chemotaxis protein MotC